MNYPAASCEVSMKGKELNPDASIEEFSRLNKIALYAGQEILDKM
jgi:hypothetical protein